MENNMLARPFAVTIVNAALLLSGCQTLTQEGFLVPEKRDQTPRACPSDPECYVQVDPGKSQWVPEYIRVDKGKKLVLWLESGWDYEDTPITLKPGQPAILDCREKSRSVVKCKVSDEASPERKYGYTIHVKGRPPYDPFVWPR
jgi:hypothetical protein